MKATEIESKQFDKALDTFIELYNNLEADVPVIQFSNDVLQQIEQAKQVYGNDVIDEKINIVIRELLSWLDLTHQKDQKP
ncbi:atypical membrane-integrating protein (Mistic protein) [Cerasibacillus sp. JNUCC 74]